MLDLENKFKNIENIYDDIAQTPPEKKLEAINNLQPNMERLKIEIQQQHKFMQKQSKLLKQALTKTVNVKDLKEKIVEKFFGYLRVNVNKKSGKVPRNHESLVINESFEVYHN